MFSTSFKLRSCALVLLLSIVGLATATYFEGSSVCGIQIHRASGLVVWCEAQGTIVVKNTTIYVAPMNATSNRVAIYNSQSTIIGSSTYATPYLDTTSGQIMIVVRSSTFVISPDPQPSSFQIVSGSVYDLKNWTTVYTQYVATETLDTASWINGVFLFTTILDTSHSNTSIAYKAFVPSNNGFSFVEVFSYSTIVQTNVRAWAMDGTSRLCLSLLMDNSTIVCRSLTNSSADLVIHSDEKTISFLQLVSDNNGRVFWGEFSNGTSLRIWAANSDKTDTPAVIDRTTNTTFVALSGLVSTVFQLGYDSYNKLVYWTENIATVPQPSVNDYSFGVFGWDGKTSAVVTYFVAENISTTAGPICTYNGQMMLTSTVNGGAQITSNVTRHLYRASASSAGTPDSVLVFTHTFSDFIGPLSLVCDAQTGWAVTSFSDIIGNVASFISAIRIDNTTSLSIELNTNINFTLGSSTVTDGVIGYTLGNEIFEFYNLLFYTLPVVDDVTGMPSSSDNTPNGGGNNTPNTNSNTPSGKVSFANQLVPFAYFASLAYLFF